ncbi:MAG: CRISPR system precrRNA processing endoribonuclease RAMP protein Cas6 [Lachnospiraceae bacterium]
MFEHIDILTMRASFAAQDEGSLPPYLGSTLRGILGHCMREFVCLTPRAKCYLCSKRGGCSYAQCFCTPGNEGGAVNPFVLHALVHGKTAWKVGDVCTFDITLIGKTTSQAGVFLDALQDMGKRGWGASRIPFQLEQIINPDSKALFYSCGKTWMRNIQPHSLTSSERTATAALVRFDTPLRILVKRELCRRLTFEIFVASLSRRVSLLSQAYTDKLVMWEWEEETLLEAARKVKVSQESWRFQDFRRYSMNQDGHSLPLPAMEGWVLYEGNLTPFIPLLEAGHILHIGKSSTIGFGHYDVVYDR